MKFDPSASMGRTVPTAQQVFDVIMPHLRLMTVYGEAIRNTSETRLPRGADGKLSHGADKAVDAAMTAAVAGHALEDVQRWSKEDGLVFDSAKVSDFIARALDEAKAGSIEWSRIEHPPVRRIVLNRPRKFVIAPPKAQQR